MGADWRRNPLALMDMGAHVSHLINRSMRKWFEGEKMKKKFSGLTERMWNERRPMKKKKKEGGKWWEFNCKSYANEAAGSKEPPTHEGGGGGNPHWHHFLTFFSSSSSFLLSICWSSPCCRLLEEKKKRNPWKMIKISRNIVGWRWWWLHNSRRTNRGQFS